MSRTHVQPQQQGQGQKSQVQEHMVSSGPNPRLNPNHVSEIDMSNRPEARMDGQLVRDATENNPDRPSPPVKKFRVIKGGTYSDPFTRGKATLKEGKEIDALNYDILSLQRQGIKLELIAEETRDESTFVTP